MDRHAGADEQRAALGLAIDLAEARHRKLFGAAPQNVGIAVRAAAGAAAQ
jgi:hypothetical protein